MSELLPAAAPTFLWLALCFLPQGADLFLPGANRARTAIELARVFAHRRGFAAGALVGWWLGLAAALAWPR